MPQIPAKANFTDSAVTEGGFRSAFDQLHDFLTGMLGSDGTPSAARSQLGLKDAATKTAAELNYALIPKGTAMLFPSPTAPAGWTQDTSVNDRVLRVVSGTSGGGVGGSWTISGLNVHGHTLTISQIPSHNHGGGNHRHHMSSGGRGVSGSNDYTGHDLAQSGLYTDYSGNIISYQGGNGSHDHGISHNGAWRPAYLDVITATKD